MMYENVENTNYLLKAKVGKTYYLKITNEIENENRKYFYQAGLSFGF